MTKAQSYHSSIRALRAEFGLTHKQALKARKGMAERLGRPPLGKDVKAHPRIAKQEATKTSKRLQREQRPAKEKPPAKPVKRRPPERERGGGVRRPPERERGGGVRRPPERERGGGAAAPAPPRDLRGWDDYLDVYDGDYETIEYDDTGGYKEN